MPEVRRREFMTLLGGTAVAWPLVAHAEQGKLARIGVLVLTSADAQSLGMALGEGLRELGYAEGQNFTLEFRSADGNADRLPGLAAERKSVDLLRDMLPSLRRVAVLANPVDPFTRQLLEQVHLAGRTAGINIAPVAMAQGPDEVEAAFATMTQERAEAVVVQGIFFSRKLRIWRSSTVCRVPR